MKVECYDLFGYTLEERDAEKARKEKRKEYQLESKRITLVITTELYEKTKFLAKAENLSFSLYLRKIFEAA